MQTIDVSEVFLGQQGEGPSLGTRALFVRLHGCSLACTWCDTKYTWDKTHPGYNDRTQHSLGGLVDRMMRVIRDDAAHPPRLVVLTGGEPLLWQNVLPEVIDDYQCRTSTYVRWEIETSGSITPSPRLQLFPLMSLRFNVSHKLPSAGNVGRRTHNTEALEVFLSRMPIDVFKPVVDPNQEGELSVWLDWIRSIAGGARMETVRSRIYLMPRGDTREMVLDNMPGVAKLAANLGVNYTTRAHTLMYGNRRGV